MPNGRCRLPGHGGKTTGAPIKHGGRSKLWKRLGLHKHARDAKEDPELRSHHENLVLIEAMIRAEGDRATPSTELWAKAIKLYDGAVGDLPAKEKVANLVELGKVLKAGPTELDRDARIRELVKQQTAIRAAEDRREQIVQTSMSARQADGFVAAILTIFKEEVRFAIEKGELKSDAVLKRVVARLARLVSPESVPRSLGG